MPEMKNAVFAGNPVFKGTGETQPREAKDSSEYNRKRTADLVTNGGLMKAELLGLDNKIQRAIDKSVNDALDKSY